MPDQLATLRTFVKWAERIEYPANAPALVARAFQEMLSGRRGPASLEMPADSRASRIAALSSDDSTLFLSPSANWASDSDRDGAIFFSTLRILPCAIESSIIFAMKIVQVISEAKARPTMTDLTTMSADRNIDQGENSRSVAAVALSDLAVFSADGSAGDGAPGPAAAGAGTCAAGAAVIGGAASVSEGGVNDCATG